MGFSRLWRRKEQEQEKDVTSCSMEINLAHDVIINIFSRLPVASVIKCKCVCKAWRALVEDPYFAEIHTGKQSSDPCKISLFLVGINHQVLSFENRHVKLYIEDLICDADEVCQSFYTKLITPFNYSLPSHDDYFGDGNIDIIGTCNGLVCLSIANYSFEKGFRKRIVVHNPVTKEYVNIPPQDRIETLSYESLHKFGYHPATREYKILKYVHGGSPPHGSVHVYTLGSGTWRKKEARIQYNSMLFCVHFDGCLYWLCYNTKGVHIRSFDLGDEELRMLSGAPQATQLVSEHYCYKLTVLERNLCVIEGMRLHEMNIWVMKKNEENNSHSWTKDFIIPDNSVLHYPNPKLFIKGGEILGLKCDSYGERVVFCFDSKRAKTLRSLPKAIGINGLTYWKVASYTRSIVSLKALGEKDVRMAAPPAVSFGSMLRCCIGPMVICLINRFFDDSD